MIKMLGLKIKNFCPVDKRGFTPIPQNFIDRHIGMKRTATQRNLVLPSFDLLLHLPPLEIP